MARCRGGEFLRQVERWQAPRQGHATWPDGSSYDGEWINDKQHGEGKFTLADGRSYDCGWRDNKITWILVPGHDAGVAGGGAVAAEGEGWGVFAVRAAAAAAGEAGGGAVAAEGADGESLPEIALLEMDGEVQGSPAACAPEPATSGRSSRSPCFNVKT